MTEMTSLKMREKLFKEAQEEIIRISVKVKASCEVLKILADDLIKEKMMIAGVAGIHSEPGPLVLVNFDSGDEVCRYEGIFCWDHNTEPRVILRRYTKKRKPMKYADQYPMHGNFNFRPVKQGDYKNE